MAKQQLIKAAESVKSLESATNSLDEAIVRLERNVSRPKKNGHAVWVPCGECGITRLAV